MGNVFHLSVKWSICPCLGHTFPYSEKQWYKSFMEKKSECLRFDYYLFPVIFIYV